MNKFHFSLLFTTLVSLVFSHELNEDTAFLLTCPISTAKDLDFLHSLAAAGHPIDIFQEKVLLGTEGSVVQLLTDELTSEILLSRANCFEEKGRSSVKRLFSASAASPAKIGLEFHDDYRSYDNILDQLDFYAKTYPEVVKLLKSVGKSHEGRDLPVIHITAAKNKLGTKPLIWIMAGQHAREWIATSSAMLFIENILHNHELLDEYEFAVMPLVNPDGYEYSRSKNRMWRKNRRSPNGVDLNRNWDHRWCEIGKPNLFNNNFHVFIGSSREEYTDDYCGPSAASEPEIHSTQKYILSLPNRAIGFDVHSYSQLILRNYGWTRRPSPHERVLSAISKRMADSMKSLYNVKYTPMLSAGLYPSSGSAEDWLYVKAGIPGFVMELRDKGQYGFHLPRSQIKPTGMELYIGIITAIASHNITEFIPS